MFNTTPTYPKICSDSDLCNVKIKSIDSNNDDSDDKLTESSKDEKIKINDFLTKRDEKILMFKCELIELMKKQLETIDLIISLK